MVEQSEAEGQERRETCRRTVDGWSVGGIPDPERHIPAAADYIRSHNVPKIKASQVDELAEAIVEWQGTLSRNQIDSHVSNLKKHHSAVREGDAPACPYCGGRMVLRTRKKDGSKFYGCESYPACRGIVNIG